MSIMPILLVPDYQPSLYSKAPVFDADFFFATLAALPSYEVSVMDIELCLKHAIGILREDGWTQGSLVSFNEVTGVHSYCAVGAMLRSADILNTDSSVFPAKVGASGTKSRAVAALARRLTSTVTGRDIAGYNDHQAETVDDVIARIEETIDKLVQCDRATS